MKKRSAVFLFGLWTLLAATAWAQEKSLGDLARELRAGKKATQPCPPEKACDQSQTLTPPVPGHVLEDEQPYKAEIQTLMEASRFDSLEKEANRVRTSKERVTGGTWKLFLLYEAISQPVTGDRATESEWTTCIEQLKRWGAARPQSITARVALAQAYVGYAWFARGEGSADTVSESDWQLFGARADQASNTLKEALSLSAKCPQFFYVTLLVARAQNWPLDASREVFERAIAFEPSYYHTYREFTFSRLPKWFGQEGDAEAFAEESAQRIGGREGALIYFELASLIYCQCSTPPEHPTLSWPKIQEGFAVMEEKYGASMTKLNRFASLAYLYQDHAVAKRTLERVGDNWEISAWGKRSTFDRARAWAHPEPAAAIAALSTAGPPFPTASDPRLVPWQADMNAAYKATFSHQFEQGEEFYQKALNEAEQIPPLQDVRQALPMTLRAFGSFYAMQGKFPEAERLLLREIKVREQRGATGDFQSQTARQTLAMTYIMMRHDYKSAEAIAAEIVEIAEHHPPVGYDPLLPNWLDFLAEVYKDQQQFEKAQPLLERALAIDEKLQGPDAITVTVRLDHLGALYRDEGAFDKAEPVFRRELDLDELHNGKSSPAVLGPLSQLVDLMKKMGRHPEAAQFQERFDGIQKTLAHP